MEGRKTFIGRRHKGDGVGKKNCKKIGGVERGSLVVGQKDKAAEQIEIPLLKNVGLLLEGVMAAQSSQGRMARRGESVADENT